MAPLLIAGCGWTDRNQAESAGGAADSLIKTCAANRPSASVEVLTPQARDFFVNSRNAVRGCLDLLGLRSPAELGGTRVVSVHANDLSAAAELRGPNGRRSYLELENFRGVWSVMHPAEGPRPSP